MPVDNPDVIDLISTRPDAKGVVLVISDHLDWDDLHTHLSALQTKINRYLAYVQSQEFLDKYPTAQEIPAHIEVMCAYPPSPNGDKFLNLARERIGQAGWSFGWQVIPSPLD